MMEETETGKQQAEKAQKETAGNTAVESSVSQAAKTPSMQEETGAQQVEEAQKETTGNTAAESSVIQAEQKPSQEPNTPNSPNAQQQDTTPSPSSAPLLAWQETEFAALGRVLSLAFVTLGENISSFTERPLRTNKFLNALNATKRNLLAVEKDAFQVASFAPAYDIAPDFPCVSVMFP